MTESNNCPSCQGPLEDAFLGATWRIGDQGRVFTYGRCLNCRLVMANPIPSPAEITAYYSGSFDYNKYAERKLLKRWQGSHRWRRLRPKLAGRHAATRRLLDVGCGHGWFLRAAAEDGWEATGQDFPSAATRFAREALGLSIIEGDFATVDLPTEHYDVVSLWHALEHMRDPSVVLARARTLLKPGGILIIAVPNVDSRGLKTVGAGWIWLQQPFVHLWHYSPSTLDTALRKAGFGQNEFTTCDTWDANYLYDGYFFPRHARRWINRIAWFAGRQAGRLGGNSARVEQRAFFYLDEGLRLLVYAVYSLQALILRKDPSMAGSELLGVSQIDAS
jgi:SAM-dependent methyltransferase